MTDNDSAFKGTIMIESSGLITGIIFYLFGIITTDRSMEIIGTITTILFVWLIFYAVSVRITESENKG